MMGTDLNLGSQNGLHQDALVLGLVGSRNAECLGGKLKTQQSGSGDMQKLEQNIFLFIVQHYYNGM